MAHLIKRKQLYSTYPDIPFIKYNPFTDEEFVAIPGGVSRLILGTNALKLQAHKSILYKEMKRFFVGIGATEFVIFGASDTPWLFREKSYTDSRSKRIMESFRKSGIKPQFNGAVKVELKALWPWLRDVSRCVSVNALVQEMYFMDINEKLFFSPCKHENIHVSFLTQSVSDRFMNFLPTSELRILELKNCGAEIYNKPAIAGRKLLI